MRRVNIETFSGTLTKRSDPEFCGGEIEEVPEPSDGQAFTHLHKEQL